MAGTVENCRRLVYRTSAQPRLYYGGMGRLWYTNGLYRAGCSGSQWDDLFVRSHSTGPPRLAAPGGACPRSAGGGGAAADRAAFRLLADAGRPFQDGRRGDQVFALSGRVDRQDFQDGGTAGGARGVAGLADRHPARPAEVTAGAGGGR